MIPAGNISLEEAAQLYMQQYGSGATDIPLNGDEDDETREQWWREQAQQHEKLRLAFAQPFKDGLLIALVFDPKQRREFEITRSQWQQIVGRSFWDISLLHSRIDFSCDPALSQYRGLTAYTRRDSFLAWLSNGERQQVQQNVPVWKRASRSALQEWYSDWTSGGATAWLKLKGRARITPIEDDDLAAAREKFGDTVTRDMIRDNRRAAAPDEWKRKGRKPRQR